MTSPLEGEVGGASPPGGGESDASRVTSPPHRLAKPRPIPLQGGGQESTAPDPLRPFCGETGLFIHEPFTFRAVDALVTNFHLPRTTLLLLVGALAGSDLLQNAYAEAVAREYRFFSYGDAMIVL